MKNKIVLFMLIVFLGFNILNAEKLYEFSDIYEPYQIVVDNNFLYVADQYCVKQFSLENYRLIRKFGQKGEGPGELSLTPRFQILPETKKLLVRSHLKAVLFDNNGNVQMEKRFQSFLVFLNMVSNNFVMRDMSYNSNHIEHRILFLDEAFKKIKSILISKSDINKKSNHPLMSPKVHITCSLDWVFVSKVSEGIGFLIYDKEGNLIKSLDYDYKNIIINKKEKKIIRNEYISNPLVKKLKNLKKKKIMLMDIYPAIRDLVIADKKIYIRTYLKRNGREEVIILNFDGKLVKKVFLPILDTQIFSLTPPLYSVKNSKYYYLKENEENESYDLYCEKIK